MCRITKNIWYYTEEDNWLEPGGMPEEWIEVVRGVHDKSDYDLKYMNLKNQIINNSRI